MAPHVFVEPIRVESIARIRETYRTTDLRARLAKYHARVDDAFLGWADTWLRPGVPGVVDRGAGRRRRAGRCC